MSDNRVKKTNETKRCDEPDFLEVLRKSSFSLECLPDSISVLPVTEDAEEISVPVINATVDDIAFAQQGLNGELSRIVQEMEALRRIHDMARSYGAKGADCALATIEKYQEESA